MTQDSLNSLFFALLRYYVGTGERPVVEDPAVWQEVYDLAKVHALTGIVFSVAEKYPREEAAPKMLLREWLGDSHGIDLKNRSANEAIGHLLADFEALGYRCVLLKGQGAAMMYPTPKYRSSGDIDLWVDGDREKLIGLVRKHNPKAKICHHHGDYGKVDGVPVELHFLPTWLYNPIHDRRLQAFFRSELAPGKVVPVEIGDSEVNIPGVTFNAVFMLVHMYKHIFNEGLGLRQLMDYFFVLNDGSFDRPLVMRTLRRTGLVRFAGAVMYLMKEVFGIADERLLLAPDEVAGRALLGEVMKSGNFGARERREGHATGKLAYRQKRLWRFLFTYPSEVLCAPLWKAWHWCWRRVRGY